MRSRAVRHRLLVIAAGAWLALAAVATAQPPSAGTTTVFLVRHAERVSMTDPDSPLSDAGHARAQALAQLLADAGVTAIITSDRLRTQQTAAPLAEARRLRAEVLPADQLDAVVARIRSGRGGTILVVHHSNTVPALAETLGAAIPPIADDEYDRVVMLTLPAEGPARALTLRFRPWPASR